MLRTNQSFLLFIEELYRQQPRKEDIVLKTFPVGSLLLRQGGKALKVFVIKEGITKCYFSEDNGKDYIVEFLGEGEVTGELEALKSIPCLCNIQALTEVQAYALDASLFGSLLEKNPTLNRLLLDVLAERIVNTATRSSSQQLYTLEHSLRKLLSFQDRLSARLSKEDMAAYLGITTRSLNRALKELKDKEQQR